MTTPEVNVAAVERWASALSGAALTAYGIKQMKEDRPVAGAMIVAAGHIQAAIAGNDLPVKGFTRSLERRLEPRPGRGLVTRIRIWCA